MKISRVSRTKEEARKSYNRISEIYNILLSKFEKKYKDKGLELLDAKKEEEILEIGFGTGDCILQIADSVGNNGKVYGIDISDGMYEITKNKILRNNLDDIVELELGDASKLSYEDNKFDAIFMSFTLELFDTPEIPIVLNECRRVLKDNSRICIVSLDKKKDNLINKIYEWFHKKMPNLVDCRPILVRQFIQDADFKINIEKNMSMWGLTATIILAYK